MKKSLSRQKFCERLKNIHLVKRIKRFNDINEMYGKQVRKLLNEGKCKNDISKVIKKGLIPTTKYLEYYGLLKQATSNGEKIRLQKAIKQFNKNSYNAHLNKIKKFNSLPKITSVAENIYKRALNGEFIKKELLVKLDSIGQKHNFDLLRKRFGNLPKGRCGNKNGMYGISPALSAGRGINGHIKIDDNNIFFRSSLELKIYYYLITNNIKFSLSKHRISFNYKNKPRTYNPDIVIDNCIYEIKPKNLINLPLNIEKFKALKKYCSIFNLKCDYITEDTYNIKDIFNKKQIELLINQGKIVLSNKQEKRLLNILK